MNRTRQTKLVVGLGNPGRKYDGTRHNIGFEIVDRLAERFRKGSWSWFKKSPVLETRHKGRAVVCLKPGLYMNRSGGPTKRAMLDHGVKPQDVLVVYDDLDLELGRLRLRARGSSGGHKGVADIGEVVGENFHRLRFGINRPPQYKPVEDYVLEPFADDERETVANSVERAVEACMCWLDQGLQRAMNEFNKDQVESSDDPSPESTAE